MWLHRLCLASSMLFCVAARSLDTGATGSPVSIEAGSGRVVTLATPAASVFAADPKVVEVRPASASTLFLFGVSPGHTVVAAMAASGKAIAQFDVTVSPNGYSARSTSAQLTALNRGQTLTAGSRSNGLALQGMAASPLEAETAVNVARANMADGLKVENDMSIRGGVQVNLRVRVVEMSRSLTRELGVNWQALANVGGRYGTLGFSSAPALVQAATSSLSPGYNFNTPGHVIDINGVIDALAQDQLVHVLAEPNLTTTSGEPASFLVGGEFPIPVAVFNESISVEFKQYGVSLAFVPTVLNGGRISLHVRPEVSELSTQGAVTLQANNSSIQIPALQVRRADTTVELGSGQSFAIAGLLQDETSLTANGIPWLGDIPILGALFRSDSFQRNETELVIVVTPYLVRAVGSPEALSAPDDGWRPPNDLERILLLRQKASGQRVDAAVRPVIPSQAGFMVQ